MIILMNKYIILNLNIEKFHSRIQDEYLNYHIWYDSVYKKKFIRKIFDGYWDNPNLYYFETQVYFCEKLKCFIYQNINFIKIELLDFKDNR